MNLVEQIQAAQARNLAALSAKTPLPAPKDLRDAERGLLANFAKFCAAHGVSECPAAPVVIAAWIRSERAIGIESERVLATLAALAKAHDVAGLANPICTHAVRAACEEFLDTSEAPQSWNKEERYLWAVLPPDIRTVISRRDRQQCLVVRRVQNETAELRNKLKSLQPKKEISDVETTKEIS